MLLLIFTGVINSYTAASSWKIRSGCRRACQAHVPWKTFHTLAGKSMKDLQFQVRPSDFFLLINVVAPEATKTPSVNTMSERNNSYKKFF